MKTKSKLAKVLLQMEKGEQGNYLVARIEKGVSFEKLYFINGTGKRFNPLTSGGLVCHIDLSSVCTFENLPETEKAAIEEYKKQKAAERETSRNVGDAA